MNSLPKTVTRQHRGCDLNPGPSAPEPSTLTTRLPSHPKLESTRAKSKLHSRNSDKTSGGGTEMPGRSVWYENV